MENSSFGRPTLVLIRGLPGSGKSTLAKRYVSYDSVHLEADMYMMQGRGREQKYVFDKSKLGAAHSWCQDTTRIFLQNNYDVYVSNTFTTLKEIAPYQQIAREVGATMDIWRLTTDFGSIHNVPEETIQRMKDRFEDFNGEFVITEAY